MRGLMLAGASALAFLFCAPVAQAKPHPYRYAATYWHAYVYPHMAQQQHMRRHVRLAHRHHWHRVTNARVGRAVHIGGYDRGQIVAHPAGCPARLFCGCGASIEAFGRSIRDLWSVSSWWRFPRTAPADGMAVIWPGRHVAIIRHYHGNGIATLYDANSGGGLTRIHRRNIAGLPVVNPHPGAKRSRISWASASPL